MLACDGCEIWFHGDCVGMTQQQAARAKEWRCKPCARKHEQVQAATATYCICDGPWDRRSFMIACDSCSTWFHGACVGLRVESATEGAQAAFRRYLCPSCAHSKEHALPTSHGGGKRICRSHAGRAPEYSSAADIASTLTNAAHGSRSLDRSSSAKTRDAVASLCARWGGAVDGMTNADGIESLGGSRDGGHEGHRLADAATGALAVSPGGGSSVSAIGSAMEYNASGSTSGSSSGLSSSCRLDVAGPCLLLEMLTDDCLEAVLSHCSLSHHLLSVAPTSRRLAQLSEPHFMLFCMSNRWRPARRFSDHPFRWRVLIRQKACAVCVGKDAFFPVRKGSGGVSGGGATLFRLCRDCARRDKVQQQVNRHGYEVCAAGSSCIPIPGTWLRPPSPSHSSAPPERFSHVSPPRTRCMSRQVDAIGENGKALFARQFHIPLFGHANGFSNNLQAQVNKHGL